MRYRSLPSLMFIITAAVAGATTGSAQQPPQKTTDPAHVARRVALFAPVRLTADLSDLSDEDRQILRLLIEAAKEMDKIFWLESFGPPAPLLNAIQDPQVRRFAEMNYGPWDRLAGNTPFVPGHGPKPPGANYYPADLTREQFEKYLAAHPEQAESLKSLYTVVHRGNADQLVATPFHQQFAQPTQTAAEKLRAAAKLAQPPSLARYLNMRAEALLTDNYQPSDLAWMDMKDNRLDVVIGPIETYEDQLFGYKAAHEAYVLLKDVQWSQRLARFAQLLPQLQQSLPVDEAYRQEQPGTDSDLNAYDVLYYAGDCNAGAKTIAINLPNDEEVQLKKGTRRLQLKNAMRAKYDKIVVPISEHLIVPEQRQHVTFDAFFSNVMLHEVAHGLGVKNTITDKGTVREALKDLGPALEECKADILGLYLVAQLRDMQALEQGELMDNYVTFLSGIFRSVRFGASSAHGRANLIAFRFFEQQGAFTRNDDGLYQVDAEKMQQAIKALSAQLLQLQGNGDYAAARQFSDEMGQMPTGLQADLQRINEADIPVDVVFEQGIDVLGL